MQTKSRTQLDRRGPLVVIGSVTMDLVCRTPKIPGPGETIQGMDFVTIPGGRGANQAVAAAKLGAEVHLIARVGEDDFGTRLLNGLTQHKVNTRHVVITEGVASGCALTLVDKKGENAIVVAPGANHKMTPKDLDAAEDLIKGAGIVLLQLEIPLVTAEHAITLCRRAGVSVILDPSPVPAEGLPAELFAVDVLTPNQNEAEALTSGGGIGRMGRTKRPDAKQLAGALLAKGPRNVVLKLGRKGAVTLDADGNIEHAKGFAVDVVDTTAAGDVFSAALAVALSEGKTVADATRFANAAGALCCHTFGAQPAMPSREAVDKLLRA